MIAVPPSLSGAVHDNSTYAEVVLSTVSIKAVGGSGTVGRIVSSNEKVYSEYREGVVTAVTRQVKLPA